MGAELSVGSVSLSIELSKVKSESFLPTLSFWFFDFLAISVFSAMSHLPSDDVEKSAGVLHPAKQVEAGAESHDEAEVVPLSKLQQALLKIKVETRGIERVPDDERTDTSYLNVGSMVFRPPPSRPPTPV